MGIKYSVFLFKIGYFHVSAPAYIAALMWDNALDKFQYGSFSDTVRTDYSNVLSTANVHGK